MGLLDAVHGAPRYTECCHTHSTVVHGVLRYTERRGKQTLHILPFNHESYKMAAAEIDVSKSMCYCSESNEAADVINTNFKIKVFPGTGLCKDCWSQHYG